MKPLRSYPQLAIDIETKDEGLRKKGSSVRRGGYVVGASIANHEWVKYYPLRHVKGDNIALDIFYKWLRDELKDYTGEIITANGLYDADFLAHEGGVEWPKAKWCDV